jgi:hypothetical protein
MAFMTNTNATGPSVIILKVGQISSISTNLKVLVATTTEMHI